ncbi:pyridoxal phosphate-dependent aminotransferase [Psychrobium sp. 1_MG-2023]|uniref:pyridoxal phosphate-dependent aminotransferase n=1 Tax=Psychrobium sp. 1_MG-2023 TaxID=3062624 RepID=UPI000C334F21|nr:pyridoxal phosphate-dependent aminotransferase [Psychrobium sp. 1_MG-2023]MDP2561891.1 pyridoxal phosphate-dependent aminotransferase [Psychrobium sp. 1_MG-2023]PKF59693.1 aminotransferase [Alteromonadales bacterium alter-6D02]
MSNWSERAQQIESFKVMDLLSRANELKEQGRDIISMGAGEPDFSTPPLVAKAGIDAIVAGETKYTPSTGIPALQQAIAHFYLQRYQLTIAPERIVITSGASAGLLMVFSLLTDANDNFLLADPGYPCNKQFLRVIEAKAKNIAVSKEDNFQLTAKHIDLAWDKDTAGVLIASPANPTGTMLTKEQLSSLSASVRAKQGYLVVDELYHGLTYEEDAHSVLEVDDDAFVINSFSKYFGMTGWRLGWVVAPKGAVSSLERLAQNLFISPSTIAQHAALAAFHPQTLLELERRRWEFKARRDLLVAGLEELGFKIEAQPQGAFYLYVNASRFTDDSYTFCWQLLEDDGIVVTPGIDFGTNQSNQFIRFSYTTSITDIKRVLRRLSIRLDQPLHLE